MLYHLLTCHVNLLDCRQILNRTLEAKAEGSCLTLEQKTSPPTQRAAPCQILKCLRERQRPKTLSLANVCINQLVEIECKYTDTPRKYLQSKKEVDRFATSGDDHFHRGAMWNFTNLDKTQRGGMIAKPSPDFALMAHKRQENDDWNRNTEHPEQN
jgi:hypothetical protein